tara:strand:- start:2049 stop:2708 length:660 start_codon:yes stop_codon:yes gene_type:complete
MGMGMPKKRITMRKLRDLLRLRLHAQLSMRHIRDSLRISLGTIQSIDKKVQELTLDWSAIEQLDDQALARCFYPQADVRKSPRFEVPNWAEVHQELKGKGVTKHLLWEEYAQQYPNRCYSYSQFCDRYLDWLKKQRRSMRQIHKAGDKLFVDYAGQTVPIVSGSTGEVRTAQIFVAVMGHPTITSPRRRTAKACPIGWAVMPEPLPSWAACPRWWYRII